MFLQMKSTFCGGAGGGGGGACAFGGLAAVVCVAKCRLPSCKTN